MLGVIVAVFHVITASIVITCLFHRFCAIRVYLIVLLYSAVQRKIVGACWAGEFFIVFDVGFGVAGAKL